MKITQKALKELGFKFEYGYWGFGDIIDLKKIDGKWVIREVDMNFPVTKLEQVLGYMVCRDVITVQRFVEIVNANHP